MVGEFGRSGFIQLARWLCRVLQFYTVSLNQTIIERGDDCKTSILAMSGQQQEIEEEKKELEEDDGEQRTVKLSPMKVLGEIAESNANENADEAVPAGADRPVKLYKSSRLKGYITLTLASFINYQAAEKSDDVQESDVRVVPSTPEQKRYALAVAVVSLVLSVFCLLTHLDRLTPLEKIWITFFKNGSKIEGMSKLGKLPSG